MKIIDQLLYIKCSCSITNFSCDLLVAMAAQFYGSVDNESCFVEQDGGIVSTTEVLANQQEYQSTMLVCDEINKEVKNLRMEVATLKTTIEDVRSENREISQAPAKTSGKLPEGLSVRKYKVRWWCCMCCMCGVIYSA